MGIRLADMSADLREHYEERAAIIEFDAGMPRADAEKLALQDVLSNSLSSAEHECQQGASYGTKARRSACGG